MPRHSAPFTGRLVAAIVLTLVTAVGCSVDDPSSPAAPENTALTAPTEIGSAQQCKSKINSAGLVCSRCPGDAPGAGPECLAAACTVDGHSLVCKDPKGRVGVDSSIDYAKFVTGSFSSSSNAMFNFAMCTFQWGIPKSSGTTCYYPGANTCRVVEHEDSHCVECNHPDGSSSSVCGAKDNPLYDPLIDRPDDLPAPGFCVNDLSADGKVECTTCVHGDLSATRSCHYPGIVDCGFGGTEDGCLGLCTFKDGHVEKLCDSPRGAHPVPLP